MSARTRSSFAVSAGHITRRGLCSASRGSPSARPPHAAWPSLANRSVHDVRLWTNLHPLLSLRTQSRHRSRGIVALEGGGLASPPWVGAPALRGGSPWGALGRRLAVRLPPRHDRISQDAD